jgi:TRAP-type C4-dicarboxylate transport system permease small subunit
MKDAEKSTEPKRSMVKKLGIFSPILASLGDIALVIMMFLTTADVISRYLFKAAILGVLETTELLMLILIFSYIGYTQAEKAHISVDILVPRLPKKLQVYIGRFNHLVALIFLGLIVWRCVENAFVIKDSNEVANLIQVPIFPFAIFLSLGCAVLCVEYLRDLIKLFGENAEKEVDG